MGEDNRTYNNRINSRSDNRQNSRTGNRPYGGERRRDLSSYSVDVAAERGIVRDDSVQRRNRRPGDVKVAQVGGASRRNTGHNDPVQNKMPERKRSDAGMRSQSRNVDVASARRQSGKVDVQTGRRLDGRVRVPVDKRRVQSQESTGGRPQERRRAPENDQRRPQERRRTPENDQRRPQERRRPPENDQRRPQERRRPPENDQRRPQDHRRPYENSRTADERIREKKRSARSTDKNNKQQNNKQKTKQNKKQNTKNTNRAVSRNTKKKVRRKPTPEELEIKKKLKQEKKERRRQTLQKVRKVFLIICKALLVLVIIGGIALVVINSCYKLKKINVSGTDHYTDQQVEDIVSGGKKYTNTLFFILNNKLNPPGEVTFIDKIDVAYENRNTVSITVYEKAMAGCIKYNDKYAYFDGDGIVLEISDKKLDDVPCIEGLTSDSVEQGKKLSVGDESFFQEILTMTQLIFKNDIQIDKITYDDKQNLILHKDGIKIKIGNADNLESKFMNLDSILSTLKGKKGTLDMSNYSASNGNAIFKENK